MRHLDSPPRRATMPGRVRPAERRWTCPSSTWRTPRPRCTSASVLGLRGARRAAFDYDRLVAASSAGGSPSCRATGSGSAGCPATSPTRCGSTTRTSTSPTTYGASALPKPGTDAQLRELVGPHHEPPAGPRPAAVGDVPRRGPATSGRFAILTKTHHAMVDGVSAVDIGQVILDVTPEPRETPPDTLAPGRASRPALELVAGAVGDLVRRPSSAARRRCGPAVADVRRTTGRARRGGRRRARHGAHGRRAPAPGQPAQRRDRRAAPVRHGRHRARRLQGDPQGARRHRQRRRARRGRRRAARPG